jgi:hypothetical protein
VCKKMAIIFITLLLPSFVFGQDGIVIDGVRYRDPLQPAGATRVALEDGRIGRTTYVVTFIRAGGKTDVAVVNGRTVGLGDTIDGATVQAITSDTVTLEVNGESIDISTFRATFRTDAP